jgi:hypothetical protein
METGADRIDRAPPSTWLDDEKPISRAMAGTLARLLRRARATRLLWVPFGLVFGAGFTWFKGRRFSVEATVVLRVTEGALTDAGSSLSAGSLRSYVEDRAFTRRNLLEVLARHPREFALAKVDPTAAVTNLLKVVDLTITDNDFVEDRSASDPPRSARVEVSYRAGQPALAFAIARELAEVIVESASGARQRALNRAQVAADLVLRRAEANLSAGIVDPRGEAAAAADAASARLRAAAAADAEARLAQQAGQDQQGLRFDVVDEGRIPRPRTLGAAVAQFLIGLVIGLLAGALLAGAFDPRILDRQDVTDLDLRLLGSMPALPRPGAARAEPAVRE